ncbi:MAG: hypothetical protein AB8B89_07255 [Gammaproteobacteria bacterium]
MSMILDALSRAEKERQSENAVGLDTARYATSSTIKEDRLKKWVLFALLANFALIILLSLGYVWKNYTHQEPEAISTLNAEPAQVVTQAVQEPIGTLPAKQVEHQPLESEISDQLAPQSISLSDVTNKTLPATSLLDETKVKKDSVVKKPNKKKLVKSIVKKTPPVQYSSKPLSAPTQPTKPTVESVTAALEKQRIAESSSSNYTRLSDIPVNERAQLSQYQINVHVYDDSGKGSFVLINMVKYKQGDRLPGSNASVSAIVPEGVVIDYGNGKALVERNQ